MSGDQAGGTDQEPWTVLICDGQPLFAQALGCVLVRRLPVEILEAHPQTGTDAVRAAVDLQPDVAVVGLGLRGLTGLGALRTIVVNSPDTRVVVLGWLHDAADIREALEAGASGFVSKALGLAHVVDAVGCVLAGERVLVDPNYRAAVKPSAGSEAANGGRDCGALTVRELEVLRLLGAGLPVEDIAARLDISPATAQTHINRILPKLGAHSQLEAVAVARERGYLV